MTLATFDVPFSLYDSMPPVGFWPMGTTIKDAALFVTNQTWLPKKRVHHCMRTLDMIREAIKSLQVRGANAIGDVAAFGLAYAFYDRQKATEFPAEALPGVFAEIRDDLLATRKTAKNIHQAMKWMTHSFGRAFAEKSGDGSAVAQALLDTAMMIWRADLESCRLIAADGSQLCEGWGVTYCNTGWMTTACDPEQGIGGTAIGCLIKAFKEGRLKGVYVPMVTPLLQGARLTAYELRRHGVPVELIPDTAFDILMRVKKPSFVIVGADRIGNGVINKLGTAMLAAAAKKYGVPFYVAAPTTTFDPDWYFTKVLPDIEERGADELRYMGGAQVAEIDTPCWNPAFDVTELDDVSGIITEFGLIAGYESLRPYMLGERERFLSLAA